MIHRILSVFVACTAMVASAAAAPIDSTITYQGQLLDNGQPYNGDVAMICTLYDDALGGNSVGSAVSLPVVPVSNGVFSVELDFGPGAFNTEQRWLEIRVAKPGDIFYINLTPRQRVTAAPVALAPWAVVNGNATFTGGRVGVGTDQPLAAMHLVGLPIVVTPAAILQDTFVIEDVDAIVGVYSDHQGTGGSGFVLGEISPGQTLTDTWSVYRTTAAAGSALRFAYGTDTNYTANPNALQLYANGDLETPGTVVAAAVVYTDPQTRYMSVPASAFRPSSTDTVYSIDGRARIFSSASEFLNAPVMLPHGSRVTRVVVTVNDSSAALDLQYLRLLRLTTSNGSAGLVYEGSTSGSAGVTPYELTPTFVAGLPVDNTLYSYYLAVGLTWDADIYLHGAMIEYVVDGPD